MIKKNLKTGQKVLKIAMRIIKMLLSVDRLAGESD